MCLQLKWVNIQYEGEGTLLGECQANYLRPFKLTLDKALFKVRTLGFKLVAVWVAQDHVVQAAIKGGP